MTIAECIAELGIAEILHFTTGHGALGFLATGALLPNRQLKAEERIEFILKRNCDVRKDPRWTDHNSMSITKVNGRFLEFSQAKHQHDIEVWWCILSFDPVILEHPNVVFCTGNNIWPGTIRATGHNGLMGMFAEEVPGTYDQKIPRLKGSPMNVPSCSQAEVLYPGRLPIEYLRRAYFREQDHVDTFVAQARALGVDLSDDVACLDPRCFEGAT